MLPQLVLTIGTLEFLFVHRAYRSMFWRMNEKETSNAGYNGWPVKFSRTYHQRFRTTLTICKIHASERLLLCARL